MRPIDPNSFQNSPVKTKDQLGFALYNICGPNTSFCKSLFTEFVLNPPSDVVLCCTRNEHNHQSLQKHRVAANV